MQDALRWVTLSEEKLDHRRAQHPFAAVGRGLSHGGGQMVCFLQRHLLPLITRSRNRVNSSRTSPTHVSLMSLWRIHISRGSWALPIVMKPYLSLIPCSIRPAVLFAMWAPDLFQVYQEVREALKHLKWNFAESVFAACTFNFGPRAITCPHLDFANLAWGWCAITALGTFDPDAGGHLILWDLRLVIRFPPGSTVFIPSAIIRHSNVGILSHEMRSSFTQYTAGGLFRWVRNGFMTDEDFEKKASSQEKAERSTEAATRWQDGMNMFSVIDDL